MVYPLEAQWVLASEGETIILTVQTVGVQGWQWYVNRDDGRGFLPLEGAELPTVEIAADAEMNGWRYFCRAINAGGTADSPVFTLEIVPPVDVPLTGDNAQLRQWTALLLMSGAGMLLLKKRIRE